MCGYVFGRAHMTCVCVALCVCRYIGLCLHVPACAGYVKGPLNICPPWMARQVCGQVAQRMQRHAPQLAGSCCLQLLLLGPGLGPRARGAALG